jgi:hypothetical protein
MQLFNTERLRQGARGKGYREKHFIIEDKTIDGKKPKSQRRITNI